MIHTVEKTDKKNRRIRGYRTKERRLPCLMGRVAMEHRDRTASTRRRRVAFWFASLTEPLLGFSRVIYTSRFASIGSKSRLGGSLRASRPVGPHGFSWAAKRPHRFSFTGWASMQMLNSLGNLECFEPKPHVGCHCHRYSNTTPSKKLIII